MRIITRLQTDKKLLFLVFWLLTGLIYLPSLKAGFMSDFLGMFPDVEKVPFTDFINRKSAQVKSFYQVTQLQMYVFIRLFGTHFIPWFLVTTGLHSLNGVLTYTFFRKLFRDFNLLRSDMIAIAGTLLFLFNPNITEVTVWKGGYHYLTGIMLQLLLLIWCRQYMVSQNRKYVWYALIVFAISIFTLEIFYVTPALTLFLLLGYYWKKITNRTLFRNGLFYFFLPQLVIFLAHLIMFRIFYGSWIAHYGVTSTFTMTAGDILPRIGKYLAYIILMAGHFPEKIRMVTYSAVSDPFFYYPFLTAITIFLGFVILRFKQLGTSFQIAGFLSGAIVCSAILVVPIYFDDLFSLYNSRRCYQLGLFVYILLSLCIFQVFGNKKVALTVYSVYLFICLFLTGRMVFNWRTSAHIQYGILRTFKWQTSDPVLLLNVPTYYRDIRIMPVSPYNEFNEQLKTFGYDSIQGKLYEVSSYNMQHTWDGAHVTVMDSNTLKVTLNQWGTWWLYNYVGAKDYETDLYKVIMTDPGHEYILKLKSSPPGMAILFLQDIYWRKVDMSKRGEQW